MIDSKYVSVTPVAKSVPFDNSINGFAATNVQDAIEESKNLVSITSVTSTSNQTSTSTTYANINTMTLTPAAGTYLVTFNGRASTSGVSAGGLFALAIGGVIQTDSVREVSCNITLLGGLVTVSVNTVANSVTCLSVLTVNGSQTITAQFKSTTGGTINIGERTMYIVRTA